MPTVKMVAVAGQIDDTVMECLKSQFPGWQWTQTDAETATGIWYNGWYDSLFEYPKADFTKLDNWISVGSWREFTVIA